MPNTTAAKKALRQNKKNYKINLGRKKRMKETIKVYKKLIKDDKKKEAKEQLNTVYKVLDKLAKVNYIKEGKAKRIKSRLSKKLN
jgi:ribosomal protein S20